MARGDLVPCRVAEPDAARLGRLQRRLGALADHAALGLRHQRHDADHHLVRLRHVGGDELDAGLLQAEQEMRVAGEAVELGDDQRRAVDLAGVERALQRRAIVIVLAALDLDVLLDQLPVAAVEEGLDRGALRLQPEAALALALGADAADRRRTCRDAVTMMPSLSRDI